VLWCHLMLTTIGVVQLDVGEHGMTVVEVEMMVVVTVVKEVMVEELALLVVIPKSKGYLLRSMYRGDV
jgi:hypothetical protein